MTFEERQEDRLRACAVLRNALTLEDDPAAWIDAARVVDLRLTADERAITIAAIAATMDDRDILEALGFEVNQETAGRPLPCISPVEDEARWWANVASHAEIKAWLTACYARLPAREKKAFLEAASRRAVA
ncbi:hypothetical protein HKCCE3408_12240 [Rhodobacterales bacterium HKCCE3408]|nr:hypothetical protein [Rhodobacterales bacterium HKCCE3408]